MIELPENSIRFVGLAWFRNEDYPRLLAIFEDANEMHDTWEEWQESAKKVEDHLKTEGYTVERIFIDPDTFPGWCRKAGVRINAKARSRFTAEAVGAKHRDGA
jgi:hypothetical protein